MNSSSAMWVKRGCLVAPAIAVYLFLMQSLQRAKESYSFLPVPTSYNTGPFGAKALYLLLQKAGYRVTRNKKPLESIPQNVGTLVLLDPMFGAPVSAKEWHSINQWVEAGHGLLISVSGFQPTMGWETLQSDNHLENLEPKDTRLATAGVSRFTQEVSNVKAMKGFHLSRAYGDAHDYLPLLSEEDSLRMAAVRKGRGWVCVVSDSSPFSNRLLANDDNAVLTLNIMQALTEPSGNRKVWMDEYHHGYSSVAVTLPKLILKPPVRWIVLQGVIALLLFLYSEGKRFGQPIALTAGRERPRSSRFVISMANIYRKAGARDAAYSILRDSFRRDLIRLTHLPPSATLKDLLAAAERRGLAPAELEPMLRPWAAGIDEASLLNYTRSLEEIRRRLSPGGRKRNPTQ